MPIDRIVKLIAHHAFALFLAQRNHIVRLCIFNGRHVDLHVYIERGPYRGRVCNFIFAWVSAILSIPNTFQFANLPIAE